MTISANRSNVLFDGVIAVSGSDVDSDFFDTEDIRTVIVRVEGPVASFKVVQSPDGNQEFSNGATELANGEYLMCTRYVKLHIDVNGSGTLLATMRVGSRI